MPVAVASDNTRDPFYAYGDLDMLEVFREAARILHLDHPVGDWPRAVTRDAGRHGDSGARRRAAVIAAGAPADLVALPRPRRGPSCCRRPQADRIVGSRAGRAIDTHPARLPRSSTD